MHTAPVQVTVVEYVSEFFRKYKSRAYGKSISVNAKGGADALMGMLKLVLSKGGREELRIALHCFKDQLTAATNSTPAARNQQVEELFALLSSLVDAAERLRQFSPVKESISCAVLEEVRWRLFRVLAGDGFSDAADIRRRALDLIFLSFMREQAELQQQQQRHKQLVAGGAAAAGPAAGNAAAAGFAGGSMSGSMSGRPGSPSKAARLLQRRAAGLAGPDVSSWEGLWCSLTAMSGRRMLPLLQSVMADLYLGKHIPGTPAAAAAAAGAATKAGAPQQVAKQQQQSQQPLATSRPAAGVAAGTAGAVAVGTATPTAAGTAAVVAAVVAAGDEAACGVHTPPQRLSDNDAPGSSSGQQPDVGGSPSSVDAAAEGLASEGALHDVSSGKLQEAAAAAAEADDTDTRDEGAAQAVECQAPAAAAAAAAADDALQDTEALLGPSHTADAELPAGVVYAPVLDRSTWVSCASSSFCPTETGSIDGSAFALSEASLVVCASAGAAGHDSAEGWAVGQQQQACCNPCSSPPGAGRSRFAVKLERLKESVKESVSIGGGSGSGSGSGGPAWKLPRAWVQQLRHGHDKDKDKEQQQQQQVFDLEQDQQQPGVEDDQAVSGEGDSGRVEQQQGSDCAAVTPAASLTAAASIRNAEQLAAQQ